MHKVCLIIGGSRGLGAQLLQRYQAQGYHCIEFSRSGNSEHHVDLDLTRRESAIDTLDQQFADVRQQQPAEILLLINAALIGPVGPLSGSEPKQWWANIDANLTMAISALGRFQAHFQTLSARKTVAFISSGAAHSALDGWGLYCATKAGVEQFIRVMAVEQARMAEPIHCAILDPGVMDTDMQAEIRTASSEQFSQVQRFIDRHNEGGLADPGVVADNIVAALAQPFTSGDRLVVHG